MPGLILIISIWETRRSTLHRGLGITEGGSWISFACVTWGCFLSKCLSHYSYWLSSDLITYSV